MKRFSEEGCICFGLCFIVSYIKKVQGCWWVLRIKKHCKLWIDKTFLCITNVSSNIEKIFVTALEKNYEGLFFFHFFSTKSLYLFQYLYFIFQQIFCFIQWSATPVSWPASRPAVPVAATSAEYLGIHLSVLDRFIWRTRAASRLAVAKILRG